MLNKLSFLFIVTFLLIGCGDDNSKLFTSLSESKTGIDFRNLLQESEEMNVMKYSYFYNGGGVAIGDINNDGLQDVLFTGNMVRNKLFLNKGNFEFEDITGKSGISEKQGWCTGATMVDINQDGNLDIYINRSADGDPERRRNLLFINKGDLTFEEKAQEYGLDDAGFSSQSAFFDYDKDGDLDMFLINHSLQKYTSGALENPEIRMQKNPDFAHKLYKNDNGKFTNVSDQAGIPSNVLSFGLGLAISDVNKDGWPDIYISNDFNEPDYFLMNNKDGTFTDMLRENMDLISMYAMGSDFADYNNDGLSDLVVVDMLPESNKIQKMHSGSENFDKMQYFFQKGFYYQFSRNMLQKNNGDGTFSEVGQLSGISNTDWSWATLFSDFDNDGHKDLYVSNGYVKDYTDMDFLKYTMDRTIKTGKGAKDDILTEYIAKMPTINIPDYIFQNKGDGTFKKAGLDWGIDQNTVSAGAAYADLDNDGDMDLVVSRTNDYAGIYRNNSEIAHVNNYLKIKLKGAAQNDRGIGAKVSLYSKGDLFYQEQSPVRGFQSSIDPVLNFGVGKHKVIDSVVVIWPDDKVQKLVNVKVNQTLEVKNADAKGLWKFTAPSSTNKLFTEADILNFKHTENQFNDFNVQGLLPNYLSRQGPFISKGDVNGDGREDLFIGGAAGQQGQLFIQAADGRFQLKSNASFKSDISMEDVAAEFFDADKDGDLDLYIGSGGYEYEPGAINLQDRLYINDGKGNFALKPSALPKAGISTGTVKAADVDGDGDMDLFVGGRLVPGRYPETPESMLLRNDGKGQFTNVTDQSAKMLKNIGMVTDAVWMDVNNDRSPDLIIVGDWMPIKVLVNRKGSLTDESANYIKFASSGWWNRILAEDMDGDGDKDLIIGNLGLNAQFKASEKEPVSIYYKDFDKNGSVDPIFCYFIDGVSYPAASRDDLTEQLPVLKNKFLEYYKYADAKIEDVFTAEQLEDVGLLKAQILETVYLENTGKQFTRKALPIEAQYAPVYGIAAIDANKDGKKDLIIAGNNSWTRIRFGQFTANHGVLLSGNGKGSFSYVPQLKSGLNIRGNVRSVQTINGKKPQLIFGMNDSAVKTVAVQ